MSLPETIGLFARRESQFPRQLSKRRQQRAGGGLNTGLDKAAPPA